MAHTHACAPPPPRCTADLVHHVWLQVTLPLASVPLMNVSTLDRSYILLPSKHLEAAIALLAPAGFVVDVE